MAKQSLSSLLLRMQTSQPLPLVERTPLARAELLSEQLNCPVFLKREDLQRTHSFKIRGAMEKLRSMDAFSRKRGVVAASAGNHAQGVALAAKYFRCQATIVMPRTTPQIKLRAVQRAGAMVVLVGKHFHEAYGHALDIARKQGLPFIHPYDDADVVVGQSSVGREIVEQCSEIPQAVFVPVGGGGLLAGVATLIKSLYPTTKVIAVEPDDAASLTHALRQGAPTNLATVGTFVDGASVRQIGHYGFSAASYVDEVITVSTVDTCEAIARCFEDSRTMLEPAGALALAGLIRWARQRSGRLTPSMAPLIAIASGANIDFSLLEEIAELRNRERFNETRSYAV